MLNKVYIHLRYLRVDVTVLHSIYTIFTLFHLAISCFVNFFVSSAHNINIKNVRKVKHILLL